MSVALENYGYGSRWRNLQVDEYEGYLPRMSDYHMHDYYEVSLILSGSVNVLLGDRSQSGTEGRLVLLGPRTPHYIYCEPEVLYRRINLLFDPGLLQEVFSDSQEVKRVFSEGGRILHPGQEGMEALAEMFCKIKEEKSLFRQKLLLLYVLSLAGDYLPQEEISAPLPFYVTEALSYMSTHCSEHFVAEELAGHLGISRTTLMTGVKKYAGVTVNRYLARCRLKKAIPLLQQGKSQQEVAERCGFNDACNLIRTFKRTLGLTPGEYLKLHP